MLAPLFPAGHRGSGRPAQLQVHPVRRHPVRPGVAGDGGRGRGPVQRQHRRFLLHGFSGGGQFVHRFGYLHADRLAGLSIGAPGRITYLDPDRPWWIGKRRLFADQFGDPPRVRGAAPRYRYRWWSAPRTWRSGRSTTRATSNWMDGADAYGVTRIERLEALRGQLHRARDRGPVRSRPRRRPRTDAGARTGQGLLRHDPAGRHHHETPVHPRCCAASDRWVCGQREHQCEHRDLSPGQAAVDPRAGQPLVAAGTPGPAGSRTRSASARITSQKATVTNVAQRRRGDRAGPVRQAQRESATS